MRTKLFYIIPFMFVISVNTIYSNIDIYKENSSETNSALANILQKGNPLLLCGGKTVLFADLSFDMTNPNTANSFRWCASGGPGASSCSIAMNVCSVSCNQGYYACCSTIAGCRCIENSSNGGDDCDDSDCPPDEDCEPCENA